MHLPPEEPEFGPWVVASVPSLVASWRPTSPDAGGRPVVVAVDGRSASGKSTLAATISRAVPGSVVVHTDDVAWYHSFFDWAGLVRDGVLLPVHAGRDVHYRPPAWDARGREGGIDVPAGTPLVILEGCGAARTALMPWIDRVVWTQADRVQARARGLIRDGNTAETAAFWDEWTAEELPFFAQERPWERADVVASGLPDLDHDPDREVIIAATRWPDL